MLIILEGCDGTGKSTLARSLSAILNAEIIHCSQYTPNDFKFFSEIIESSKSKNIIADRFCYGQFVYQVEEDRPLGFEKDSSLHELHRLEVKMLEAGTKVIHVTASDHEIEDRLLARGEVLINRLSVPEVQSRFRGTFKNSILSTIEWNTGGDFYDKLQ